MKYESGKETRNKILSAASQLFYENGYEATTYDDIAKKAYVNRGSIYYHFKTKDAIRGAIVEEEFIQNVRIARLHTGTYHHIAMTSTSLFWYKYLHNRKYHHFYTYLADKDFNSRKINWTEEENYFRFLVSAFGTENPLEEFLSGGKIFQQIACNADSVLMNFLFSQAEQYDHLSATKLEFDIIARLLKIPEECFKRSWSAAEELMARIPYEKLDTDLCFDIASE